MSSLLVNLLTFAAVFLTIFAANAVIIDIHSRERDRMRRRLEQQMRVKQRERAKGSHLLQDLDRIAADVAADVKQNKTPVQKFLEVIEQSGVEISPTQVAAYMTVSGLVLGVFMFVLLGNWAATALAVVGGALAPLLYVYIKRKQRLNKLRAQLPDAFDMMARVLRAGQTISQAIHAVAEEFSQPISLEFLYCYEQMNLGLPAEAALRDLGRRTGLLEIKIFILAVVVHRQTGGNLAQLLDQLSHVVRERFRIQGMIGSLTAQGRFQGAILLGLPPFMLFLLSLIQPDYAGTLFAYPMMLVTACCMMFVGWLWIRKVVNFDY